MPISSRRRFETILLSLVSLWSVISLRWPVEDRRLFATEMTVLLIFAVLAMRRRGGLRGWATAALPVIPAAWMQGMWPAMLPGGLLPYWEAGR